jgi:hypothetical protein
VARVVNAKQRIDALEPRDVLGCIVIRDVFVGVDPQVNIGGQLGPHALDLVQRLV